MRTVVALVAAGGLAVLVAASARPATGQQTMTDAQMTASAMSAAPAEVAANATIAEMRADGSMRVLRKGTNGFTCIAGNPTLVSDPMCLDANSMEWAHAWMTHGTPPQKVGFMYMLAGGTDASNTDPYAKGPAPGNHWIKTGPHVMVVGPAAAQMPGYPTSADPDTTKPYVMWAGTPYAHLMIPMPVAK